MFLNAEKVNIYRKNEHHNIFHIFASYKTIALECPFSSKRIFSFRSEHGEHGEMRWEGLGLGKIERVVI